MDYLCLINFCVVTLVSVFLGSKDSPTLYKGLCTYVYLLARSNGMATVEVAYIHLSSSDQLSAQMMPMRLSTERLHTSRHE